MIQNTNGIIDTLKSTNDNYDDDISPFEKRLNSVCVKKYKSYPKNPDFLVRYNSLTGECRKIFEFHYYSLTMPLSFKKHPLYKELECRFFIILDYCEFFEEELKSPNPKGYCELRNDNGFQWNINRYKKLVGDIYNDLYDRDSRE
jgi:hypothetical protein